MNIELEIMLDQSVELAEKLVALDMGEEFLEILDQFTNSFDQLCQILEKNTDNSFVDTTHLSEMMDIITMKISKEKDRLENETHIAALKKNQIPLYGTSTVVTPKKFDHRS